MLMTRLARAVALTVLFLSLASVAVAQPAGKKPLPAKGAPPAAACAAPSAAPSADPAVNEGATPPEPEFHWRKGPLKVDLGHDLEIDLPEPYIFLGMPDAGKLLERFGTFHNQDLLGVLGSDNENEPWLVTVRYEEAGYIKDDEKIDADELLTTIREGTEEANKERVQRGFSALHVGAWAEPPRYEKGAHHLVWALTATSDKGSSVNFNTRVLGRRGYVALNLVTSPENLAASKPHAATLLGATHYRPGARYEDFDEKHDKVAEYGLVGLVLGGAGFGAAKLVKIGLLAKFWKVIAGVLIAGKKAVIAVFAAGAAFLKRIFGRKEEAKG